MAEINTSGNHRQKAGVARIKKLVTRPDLTPMVDLGFLLISFFMISVSWTTPKALKLNMPADGPPSEVGKTTALTVIPLKDNRIFYYHGEFDEAVKNKNFGITSYSMTNGIGDIIRKKQVLLDQTNSKGRKELNLMIKPEKGSRFQNVVDMIDEVLINAVSRYSITEVSEPEAEFANSLQK